MSSSAYDFHAATYASSHTCTDSASMVGTADPGERCQAGRSRYEVTAAVYEASDPRRTVGRTPAAGSRLDGRSAVGGRDTQEHHSTRKTCWTGRSSTAPGRVEEARASGRVLPRCLVLALCRFVEPAVALLELASEAPPDGEAQQSVRHGSTVAGLALHRKAAASDPEEVGAVRTSTP